MKLFQYFMIHRFTSNPWTGCWIPLYAAGMIHMNVTSEVIFTGESLSTHGFFAKLKKCPGHITDYRKRRKWWYGVLLFSLSMNRGQKKISNLIRSTFLFRSWQNRRSVNNINVSIQIFLSFEIKITLRALKKDSVDDGTRLLRFTSFNYFFQ